MTGLLSKTNTSDSESKQSANIRVDACLGLDPQAECILMRPEAVRKILKLDYEAQAI